MAVADLVRPLRDRLSELDRERDSILQLLALYTSETDAGSSVTVGDEQGAERTTIRGMRSVSGKGFSPNPASATSKMVKAARAILDRTPGATAPVGSLYHQLPDDAKGGGSSPIQSFRTAVKRAGDRSGIAYANGQVYIVGNPQR